MKQELAYNK